jgi:hypothetical protein
VPSAKQGALAVSEMLVLSGKVVSSKSAVSNGPVMPRVTIEVPIVSSSPALLT